MITHMEFNPDRGWFVVGADRFALAWTGQREGAETYARLFRALPEIGAARVCRATDCVMATRPDGTYGYREKGN